MELDAVCAPCRKGKHCNEFGPDCGYYCVCPCPNEWMRSYRNYSYWSLLDNRLTHFLWRGWFCPGGWHLWDEVLSSTATDPQRRHYLSCDACGETLDITPLNDPDTTPIALLSFIAPRFHGTKRDDPKHSGPYGQCENMWCKAARLAVEGRRN